MIRLQDLTFDMFFRTDVVMVNILECADFVICVDMNSLLIIMCFMLNYFQNLQSALKELAAYEARRLVSTSPKPDYYSLHR